MLAWRSLAATWNAVSPPGVPPAYRLASQPDLLTQAGQAVSASLRSGGPDQAHTVRRLAYFHRESVNQASIPKRRGGAKNTQPQCALLANAKEAANLHRLDLAVAILQEMEMAFQAKTERANWLVLGVIPTGRDAVVSVANETFVFHRIRG
ncbi:MAG: hypothetical protein WD690_10125 [Vicinamibacterales bacterium]